MQAHMVDGLLHMVDGNRSMHMVDGLHSLPCPAQEAWKSRQQANSDILLAPIKVVEQRLQQAMDLLQSSSSSPEQLGGVLQVRGTC